MNQIPGATPSEPPTQAHESGQPAGAAASPAPEQAGAERQNFGSRGRARRRARFLRKARELAYRDLGGLVFNLHRFGQRNDALVLSKLNTLARIDDELRALENYLGEREAVTVLREAGITACARCAAIHSSEDRFCPNCGLSMGRHADLPIGVAPAPAAAAPAPQPPGPAGAQQRGPATSAAPAPAATPPAAPTAPAAPAAPGPPGAASGPPAASPPTGAPAPAAPQPAAPGPAGGRSPEPPRGPEVRPSTAPVQQSAAAGGGEELTEILRPPATDS